jgi:hypothetical protein
MNNINIKFWKKTASSQYVHETDGNLTLLALFVLGIIAALLHMHLRLRGLNIPGHHGLELMTILLFGRMQSQYRWAAVMIAIGAATTFLLHAISMPYGQTIKPAIFFMLNAFILDCLFNITSKKLPIIIKGMLLGGISFIIKPVIYIPIAIYLEVSFGSISKHGFFIPVLTHFTFGTIGAICGISLASLMAHKKGGLNKTK